jgi:5'-3' exonuclease
MDITVTKRIAIIDGDVLCYLSFEPRWNYNVDEQGNAVSVYNHETGKFEKQLKEYTQEEDAQYLRETWERFKRKVQETCEEMYCDEYLMAVQGDDNFRCDMYDFYKKHQGRIGSKPSEMSKLVPLLRKLAVQEDLAIASHGREADDYIRIWALECTAAGIDYIICSNDKDLKCIPGKHYNLKTHKHEDVDEAYGLRLYHEQLLMGDSIDNIPGIPGIGPKKAEKILRDCTTLEEFQIKVVETYMDSFGDNWKQHLLANGKLIHIQRHENDWFDLKDWPVVQSIAP